MKKIISLFSFYLLTLNKYKLDSIWSCDHCKYAWKDTYVCLQSGEVVVYFKNIMPFKNFDQDTWNWCDLFVSFSQLCMAVFTHVIIVPV